MDYFFGLIACKRITKKIIFRDWIFLCQVQEQGQVDNLVKKTRTNAKMRAENGGSGTVFSLAVSDNKSC